MSDLTALFGEPIAVYTMRHALADGTLVDAGPLAGDLFQIPVLLTAAAWSDCVAWAEDDTERTKAYGQSETGRLWDVLWMTFTAVRRSRRTDQRTDRLNVELYRIARDSDPACDPTCASEPAAELVTLSAVVAPHDDGSPVLVISFPEED